MTDDEKPRIHEQDPTLLAPASRPSVPSAGKPVKASTARSFNRDTGEWTYRPKNVKAPCGKWFAEGGNDFKCVLNQGHEQHGAWVAARDDLREDACGAILCKYSWPEQGGNADSVIHVYCNLARGHDRHRHALKDHGEPTLADLGYVTNSARAMRGEPENLDHQNQARISERGEMYDAQRKLARTADRAPERELLADEARVVDAKRRARMTHLGPALAPEFRLMEHLLGSQKPADQRRGKTKLRKVEQRLDEAA
jgi:hypothetical protein